MSAFSSIFTQRIAFDPGESIDAFCRAIPAKWAVYLLADSEDRPVQLLCVKNLRYSLKRRLAGEDAGASGPSPFGSFDKPGAGRLRPSRRVDYRELVRFVHYRRVDSAFEADCVYLEAARQIFPQSYRGMVGFRPAWFLHVNPQTEFPRYTKTIDLSSGTGMLLGPIEDKHAANRAMELAQSAFDLCRYYNILIEAPRGKACAYKEMGRCPAPCDGTISMQAYREMIARSAAAMIEPAAAQAEFAGRMREAAEKLQFEAAGRIKARSADLAEFGKGAFRFIRRIEDFRYVSLQRGPRAGTAKIFLITPGDVREWGGLIDEPKNAGDLLRALLADAAESKQMRIDAVAAERIGVVSHHLFSPKNTGGVFLPMCEIEDKSLLKAYRDLQKQKVVEDVEAEGVVKELNAMESDNH